MKIIIPTEIDDDKFVSSNVSEADYSEWSSAATYATEDCCIVTTGYHKIYESLKGTNVNHNPPDYLSGDDPWWLEVGSTNRWKMFDGQVQSQTENASFIEVVLEPGHVSAIVFLNTQAAFIKIVMTDPIEGIVYNETIRLEATEEIDWDSQEEWEVGTVWQGGAYYDLAENVAIRLNLPLYLSAQLKITIAASGDTAKCGMVILGMHKNLGATKWEPSLGIVDYSVKLEDDFGNYSITPRSFAKRSSCVFEMDTIRHVEVLRLLALYRATPLLWVISELYNASLIYGFYKDFSLNVLNQNLSECDISIEGLI